MAPAAEPVRGGVTGLAKLGALVLLLMGVLWTLIGIGLVAVGGSIKSSIDTSEFRGLGDLASGAIIATGSGIAVFAIVEILVGIFAWRGHGFARVLGILYGLAFGLGALSLALGATRGADATSTTTTGVGTLAVVAVAYLYVALIFIVRYRSRT